MTSILYIFPNDVLYDYAQNIFKISYFGHLSEISRHQSRDKI